jgi:hypothetical protein
MTSAPAPGSLTADDRLDIQDLFSRYCNAMDTDDRQAFMRLCEPGGEWLALLAQLRTRADFEQYAAADSPPFGGRHVVSSILVDELAPARASVRADVTWIHPGDDPDGAPHVVFVGGYRCVVGRTEGRWHFVRMEMHRDDVVYTSPFYRRLLGD